MEINGRKLGSFRIKKKNIIKVDSIEQNGPKLVLTIDKVGAYDEDEKWIKWVKLHVVKDHLLKLPIHLIND